MTIVAIGALRVKIYAAEENVLAKKKLIFFRFIFSVP